MLGDLPLDDSTWQLIVEAAPSGMVLVDEAGSILLVNREAERLFGYGRLELVGQHLGTLLPERFRAIHPTHRASFMRNPRSRRMGVGRDLAGLRQDGTEFPLEIGLNPINTAKGPVVLCSVIDITERKRVEEARARHEVEVERQNRELTAAKRALEAALEEVERRNQELDEFARIASHDLRSPLRGVSSLVGMLAEEIGPTLAAEPARWMALIEDRVKRMDALLVDLLEYSRAARPETTDEPVPLEELTRDMVGLMTPPDEFRVEVRALPAQVADRSALATVLRNLLDNALKHHDRADGVIGVELVEDRAQPGYVLIKVWDDGPGIDPGMHDHVFEPFASLRSKDEGGGSGMGLALVKRLVETRGGGIRLDSVPGKGAAFTFSWPGKR